MIALARPELVLIDLDGTMVDSVPDLSYAVDRMMDELEMPARGEAKVRNWVGNGIERLVKRALTDDMEAEPDAELYARAVEIYTRIYGANNAANSRLYPGVLEGLDALQAMGLRLACVTNKAGRFTLPLLSALGLDGYFELVVAGDTLPVKKPDPAPLLHAAEQLQANPGRSLMIGDSRSDVKAARAAGFAIVCVSYGYNHGEDIRLQQPDAVIDSLLELPSLLPQAA